MFFLKISLIIRKRRLRAAIPDLIVHFRRRDSREDSPVFLCSCAPWGAAKDRGEQGGRRGACAFFCMRHRAASRCRECPTLQTSLLSPANKACSRAKQGFFLLQTRLLFAASFRVVTFSRSLYWIRGRGLRPPQQRVTYIAAVLACCGDRRPPPRINRWAVFLRSLNGFQTEWLRPECPIALLCVSV